jgi:hypothetical protein
MLLCSLFPTYDIVRTNKIRTNVAGPPQRSPSHLNNFWASVYSIEQLCSNLRQTVVDATFFASFWKNKNKKDLGSMLWSQFSPIFWEKLAFFLKINAMKQFFCRVQRCFDSKTPIFCRFFGRKCFHNHYICPSFYKSFPNFLLPMSIHLYN